MIAVFAWISRLVAAGLLIGPSIAAAQSPPASEFVAVAWSSDGSYIAAGDSKGQVECWDVAQKKLAWTWTGTGQEIYKLYFNTKRRAFLVLEKYVDVFLVDELSGNQELHLELEFPERDGQYLAAISTAGYDDSSGILALAGTIEPTVHLLKLNELADQPKTQTVALGSWIRWLHPTTIPGSANTSLVVSVRREHVNKANLGDFSLGGSGSGAVDIAVCKSGKMVVALTDDGWLFGGNIPGSDSEEVSEKYRRHVIPTNGSANYLLAVGCGPGSVLVTTGVSDKYGTVQLWDVGTGTLSDHQDPNSFLIGHGQSVTSDEMLVATNGDLEYFLWQIKDSKLIPLARIFHKEEASINLRNNLAFQGSTHLMAITEERSIYRVDLDKANLQCISAPRCLELHLDSVNAANQTSN